ncbi:DUF1311 domain-containing protein [Marinobacter daepoensis]|uniref:DUF1311 domain-containing protein n=1 Tax=Marinobacter daepoensis TaxID=262077 RepID=A0ABS3BGC9_9GAMM|nr:lysozyme inhibitor LprI family protein [Marinobacter daepoensis]MBN7769295.1 DUF1311 domain-containing protein [Marinobacter daepoensis]MBY6077985.1 DUF1311 domain-containing protein [Marinobacter daepoensis]
MHKLLFFLILVSGTTLAQPTWDYQENVEYLANGDPSRIWLADGRKVEVIYEPIPWEEVDSWAEGKPLILGYRTGVGTLLHDPKTGKEIPVLSGLAQHPLDRILDQCLEENWTTLGMIECYGATHARWDAELNAHYKRLMNTLSPRQQALLRQSQKAWIAFKDAQLVSIHAIYDRDGTIWRVVQAQQAMKVTKEQAQRLNSFSGF